MSQELISIIADEVNVKEVVLGARPAEKTVASDKVAGVEAKLTIGVELDRIITPDLKEEGMVRELTRTIQDLRKEKGLTINDKATIMIQTDEAGRKFIEKNKETISRMTLLKDIEWGSVSGEVEPVKIGELSVKVIVK